MNQTNFSYMQQVFSLKDAVYVSDEVLNKFNSYRDAVLWAWENRRGNLGMNDSAAQSFFCKHYGYTPSHFSRAVNPYTKSPMDLKNDYRASFEAFVGNRAVTQYMARLAETTLLEELQARRTA